MGNMKTEHGFRYLGILQGASLLCPQDQEPIAVLVPEKESRWINPDLSSRVACRILSEITGIVFSGPKDAQLFLLKCGSLSGLAR